MKNRLRGEQGFTFIELVMVIVMIGILSSILVQKFVNIAEVTELAAEDRTIDLLRSNIFNSLGNELLQGRSVTFPEDPFSNLNKVPDKYDRFRTTKPTGNPSDDGVWMYVRGNPATSGGQITPQQAGTTLPSFRVDGFIYHQRRDHTVVRWAYDSSNGVISKKFIERESNLNREKDFDAQSRGERNPDSQLNRTR